MSQFTVNVKGESLAASTAETLIQVVASANKALKIVRWGISFNGATATDAPALIEVGRPTSAGTSSAFTPLKNDPSSDAALAAGRTAHTAEPTWGDILEYHYVTPFGGLLLVQYAFDERPVVAANGRFGFRITAAATVNANGFLVFDE